ncbi:uncharacterized protein LOC107426731 [Ziziphus jujuba]|uniref:Uncharacterized protein LOC107426731 n=1 Tax=Ziziphus jujuba TaxID=326968 RepID=A0A6P4ATE0_ZIZJJ|nr:uncharacterized protein LOC107426731 [Ziziphus jujuba]
MALKIILLYPEFSQRPRIFHSLSFQSSTFFSNRAKTLAQCSKKKINNGGLASDLAKEVARMNSVLVQREEAMEKSRELLFRELCEYLNLKAEEVKKRWGKMDDEEKWALAKGFLSEWGASFHPLSARSVKELVEEYLRKEDPSPKSSSSSSSSSSSALFPTLKKIMGFSQNE